MDGVLFCEFKGEWLFEGVLFDGVCQIFFFLNWGRRVVQGTYNVVECGLDELRRGCASKEKRLFGVLDGFGFPLLEGTLGAGVARFPGSEYVSPSVYQSPTERECGGAYTVRSIATGWWW